MLPTSANTAAEVFLLTPLREGRHDLQSRITTMNRISTHAPAGGATKLTTGEVNTDIISTHAPAGGATQAAAS